MAAASCGRRSMASAPLPVSCSSKSSGDGEALRLREAGDRALLHLFAALAQKERALISQRTKAGLAAARRRGVELGGWTAGSERSAKEAAALAERMRPVMAQLAGLSAHKAAAELNRRKIASATGGKWYAATVIKLRDRLEA